MRSVRVAHIESMIDNKVNFDASQRELLVEAERLTDTAHELWHEGRYAETELLFRRALALREQVWGADHPETADSSNYSLTNSGISRRSSVLPARFASFDAAADGELI